MYGNMCEICVFYLNDIVTFIYAIYSALQHNSFSSGYRPVQLK